MATDNQCKCEHKNHNHQPGKCGQPAAIGKQLCHDCEADVLAMMTQSNLRMTQPMTGRR